MAERTRGQDPKHERDSSNRTAKEVVHQNTPTERSTDSTLDEKSSGAGRRNKQTGLATKDGVTGSDYDGQVTD